MRFGRRAILVGGLVAAVALAAGVALWPRDQTGETVDTTAARPQSPAQTGTSNEPMLRFAPADRQDVAYGFSLETEAEVNLAAFVPAAWSEVVGAQDQGMVPVKQAATGTLALRYYEAGPGEWEVAAQFVDPKYEVNGDPARFLQALGYPFAFRMDARGQLSQFRFARGTPREAEQAMRSLLQAAQVVLPAEGLTRWQTKETDNVGTYAAAYELAGSTVQPADVVEIRKRKERYLETRADGLGLNDLVAEMQAEVTDTETRATVRPGGAWVLELDEGGRVVQRARGETLSESRSRLHLWRLESAAARFPDDIAEFNAELRSGKYVREQLYATDPRLNRMSEGLDVVDAVGKYLDLVREKKKQLAIEFLIDYLRQDPANAGHLVAVLLADKDHAEYDASTHRYLWMIVAKAGYPEAQQALWNAIADAGNSDRQRTLAMANVGQIEYPEPQLVDQVWDLYKGTTSAGEGVEKDLKAMSIMALGLLGERDKLNEEIKPVIEERLVEALQGARTAWDEQMALRGIGNSGNADALDAVEPFFHSENPNVRAAAFRALRKMDDPRAQMVLIEQYEQESATSVRLAALDALGRMPLVQPALDWARAQALSAGNERERIALVNVLGKTLPMHRTNEVALREILASDAPTSVRQAVFRYVKPSEHGVH